MGADGVSYHEEDFDFTYISLGAGVQNSALYVLSTLGERDVPLADVAIFADTGDEPQWVYDYLDALRIWGINNHGPPIRVAQKGVLSEWMVERQREGKRFVSVPVYTAGEDGSKEGMLRRQCTREFKIEPITKEVRALLGYRPRQHIKERVRSLLGISIDEASRMKPSRTSWITNAWPLVDAQVSRHVCEQILVDAGLPEPKKSSCVYCPYHDDGFWQDLKDNHPEEFEKAVEFDDLIRDMTMAGMKRPAFVHRSCVPLSEAEFDTGDPNQGDLFEMECEGMCGV